MQYVKHFFRFLEKNMTLIYFYENPCDNDPHAPLPVLLFMPI